MTSITEFAGCFFFPMRLNQEASPRGKVVLLKTGNVDMQNDTKYGGLGLIGKMVLDWNSVNISVIISHVWYPCPCLL